MTSLKIKNLKLKIPPKRRLTIGVDASRAFVKDPAGPEYYSWHLIKNLAEIDHKNRYVLYLRPKQRPNFSLPQNFKTKIIYPTRFWTQLGLAWETLIDPPDILFITANASIGYNTRVRGEIFTANWEYFISYSPQLVYQLVGEVC